MRVQPCLRRRIRSVGLLGESEGKRERKSKNKPVKQRRQRDKGWSEQSRRLKVKDEGEREKKAPEMI